MYYLLYIWEDQTGMWDVVLLFEGKQTEQWIINNYPAKSQGISPDTQLKSGDIPQDWAG